MQVKKILVISLTNIGDVILTFPVLDVLKSDFPDAEIDVIIGPKARTLLENNPNFHEVFIYDKQASGPWMIKWMIQLAKKRYDLAVDPRNSAIPFLIFPRSRTRVSMSRPKGKHMREHHLDRLRSAHAFSELSARKFCVVPSQDEKKRVEALLANVLSSPFVVIAPGAAAENKRWPAESFANVCDEMIKRFDVKIVFVGSRDDREITKGVALKMKSPSLDLTGETNLNELAHVFSLSKLAISNDSGPMHLASYMDVPVLALFGPTDPVKYGPWSRKSFFIKAKGDCPACRGEKEVPHRCIENIYPHEVLNQLEKILPGILNAK